jgi:hypothetical protein
VQSQKSHVIKAGNTVSSVEKILKLRIPEMSQKWDEMSQN